MNSSTLNFKKHLLQLFLIGLIGAPNYSYAGSLDSLVQRTTIDTSQSKLNMDAVYNRPFLSTTKAPVALGGYLEANSLYSSTDGVSEGWSFQARRLTVFMSASISNRIKFLSEIELEEGGKKIGIEFAAMDIAMHPAFNLRGGIVMNPIGAFNQNHDGPKWEFVERPTVGTQLLPATFSNAGFGIFGKVHKGKWIFGYEAYLTNGLDESIIDNLENKTYLPAVKNNFGRFEESSNGSPLVSGKVAVKNRKIGEIGISYMGGIYNQFEVDGLTTAPKNRYDVVAIDINTTISKTKTTFVGEALYAFIDVPESYTQQYGSKQAGAYLDVVQTIFTKNFFNWKAATLNIACRFDYTDWNIGRFKENNEVIGDELFAITPALSFRPSSQTVIRLNYRIQNQIDIVQNPASKTRSWLFGFSTYF